MVLRWLWPSLTENTVDRELYAACRGISAMLATTLFLYFFLKPMPRTFDDGIVDLVPFLITVALAFGIYKKSRVCAVGALLLIGFDAVLHLAPEGGMLTFLLDVGLIYFALRALRALTVARAFNRSYAATPTN